MDDKIIKSVPKMPVNGKCLYCKGRIVERLKMQALPAIPGAELRSGLSTEPLVASDGHYCIECGLPYIAI